VPQNKQRRLHPLSWPMLCFVAAHLNSRWLHGIWLMLICTVLFLYNTLINKVIHSWGASQSWEEELGKGNSFSAEKKWPKEFIDKTIITLFTEGLLIEKQAPICWCGKQQQKNAMEIIHHIQPH
jgi:hypothetical protein